MTFLAKLLSSVVIKSRLCRIHTKNVPELLALIDNFQANGNLSTAGVNSIYYSILRMAQTTENIFAGKIDRYKGITVHTDKEECESIEQFSKKLEDSLKFWKENGNRGIWFRVNIKHADWVPILAKNGFKFHHAHEEYVMMYHWLPHSENSNIPHYAHTLVGVGAVVVNDKAQVLVVSEKYSVIDRPHWKLPGGYVEPGENIVDAAIREVYEETNIRTEFHSLLTFRHTHNGMFGCSDIYIVVSLRPLTGEIKKCEREIAESKWMNIDEYLEHPHVHELNRFFLQKYLEYKKNHIKLNCFHGVHQILKKPYTLYSVTREDIDSRVNQEENN